MNRRTFFNFLPIAPVVAAGAIIESGKENDKPDNDYNTLTLRAMKKRGDWKTEETTNGWISIDRGWEPDMSREVSFGVGKDGKLWIKTSDLNWQRVVTE